MARPAQPRGERDVTPGALPDVPPSRNQPYTHDYTLQTVVEMQRSLGELSAKVDRLVADVGKQTDKLSEVRDTLNFVRGIVWVVGIVGLFVVPVATWLLNRSFPASTVQATLPPSTTIRK